VLARVRDLAGAAEHWWFRTSSSSTARGSSARCAPAGWRGNAGATAAERPPRRRPPSGARAGAGSPSGPPDPPFSRSPGHSRSAALLARRRLRARRRGGLPAAYAEALALLERRRGLVRAPTVPARDFARRAARSVPPAAAAAFWTLTEVYLAERFGGHRPRAARRALRALRDSLRA
jgi:hypothetical protein